MIPWTVACQAPLSMGFPRQEYWSELPFPPPGDLLDPGSKLISSASPELAGRFYITEPPGKPYVQLHFSYILTECKRMGMTLYITQLVRAKYNKGT